MWRTRILIYIVLEEFHATFIVFNESAQLSVQYCPTAAVLHKSDVRLLCPDINWWNTQCHGDTGVKEKAFPHREEIEATSVFPLELLQLHAMRIVMKLHHLQSNCKRIRNK